MKRSIIAQELGINDELMGDITDKLIKGIDYKVYLLGDKSNEALNKRYDGLGKRYDYTISGKNKIDQYKKELESVRSKIKLAIEKLGCYDIRNRNYPNIWIYFACCFYLKEIGYKDASIGFILGRHRTTIITGWERMESVKYDAIANLVFEYVLNKLREISKLA